MYIFRILFFALLTAGCYGGQAQSYNNLVFEGAGVRGIAYVGSLKELEKRDMLRQIERVGGTSAGAIAALCVALGYNSREIEKIIYETKIQQFNDGNFFFIGGIARINHRYGWYRGKSFTKWLEDIIHAKTQNSEITFRELHEKGFRDLYVTGTSLNHQKLVVFSVETYPEMKIKDAVRVSMSIPLYFEAVFIDSTGRIIPDKKKGTEYFDIVVDGGLTGNFPIFMFDSLVNINGEVLRISNPNTLGFRIDTPEQVSYDRERKGLAPVSIQRFPHYVGAFYSYVLENLNRRMLTESDWQRTVSISSSHIGPKVRRLSRDEKDQLIKNGQEATQEFFQRSLPVED